MKKTRMEKGITLVALVITIVILLILAVVAINAMQNNNILDYAKNSVSKYQQSVTDEETTLNGYFDFINNKTEEKYILVDSVDEMTDTSKKYVLTTDGMIYEYGKTNVEVPAYTNLVPTSIDNNGAIFNGTGYKEGYRLNSSAGETALEGSIVSGFIPYNGEVIYIGSSASYTPQSSYIHLFDASFNRLSDSYMQMLNYKNYSQAYSQYEVKKDGFKYINVKIDPTTAINVDGGTQYKTLLSTAKYIKVNITGSTGDDFVITLNQPLENTTIETQGWHSTGEAYTVPAYWLSHLKQKGEKIQNIINTAGENKSAFLWYTDAHWDSGNSKQSPKILKCLTQNTSMNKVNFGGDIVGDSLKDTLEEMNYLNEWRNAVKDLPNHHSVIGNHDNFRRDDITYDDNNFAYNFLIAPEESSDMVKGNEFNYYIDNTSEKTRYLYLSTGKISLTDDECKFIIDALTSTPDNWHVVAISHTWFMYNSTSTPTVGSINGYQQKVLDLFDAYNAREKGNITMQYVSNGYDFTSCEGKVEFCMGGHIHYQHTIYSTDGIPVILTPSDANQVRGGDTYTIGTTTESSVCGVIADYNSKKVNLIFVGRGTDEEISLT